MKNILKSVCFIALTLLAVPAFANKVYSGSEVTYVPHPTIPNRSCEVITWWSIEFDNNGNVVSSWSQSTNACNQGMVIRHNLIASVDATHINSVSIASFDIQNGGQDGSAYNEQLSTQESLHQLVDNMNQTIATTP
jgi:hypothetical protein